MTDAIMMNKRLIAQTLYSGILATGPSKVELVEYFESKRYLKACYEINELEDMMMQTLADKYKFKKYERETNIKVSKIIKDFLNEV